MVDACSRRAFDDDITFCMPADLGPANAPAALPALLLLPVGLLAVGPAILAADGRVLAPPRVSRDVGETEVDVELAREEADADEVLLALLVLLSDAA